MTSSGTSRLDERYSSATNSSDLSPIAEEACDVDLMIAAGWLRADSLGAILIRFASEWDVASGEYKLARSHLRAAHDEVTRLKRARGSAASSGTSEAIERLRSCERAMVTAELLARSAMPTLRVTQEAVNDFGQKQADLLRLAAAPGVVRILSEAALWAWINENCDKCTGRGMSGAFGKITAVCTACHGTGRRAWDIGKNQKHVDFVRRLMLIMDTKASLARQKMVRWLRRRAT